MVELVERGPRPNVGGLCCQRGPMRESGPRICQDKCKIVNLHKLYGTIYNTISHPPPGRAPKGDKKCCVSSLWKWITLCLRSEPAEHALLELLSLLTAYKKSTQNAANQPF